MLRCKTFNRIFFFFFFIYCYSIVSAQENAILNCSDIKNGTFNYFDQREGATETFVRKGDIQKEILPQRKETILWGVNWLNECTYSLKYQSGAENRSAAEQKLLSKHIIVSEILHV